MRYEVGEKSLRPLPAQVILQDLLVDRPYFLYPGRFPMSPFDQLEIRDWRGGEALDPLLPVHYISHRNWRSE